MSAPGSGRRAKPLSKSRPSTVRQRRPAADRPAPPPLRTLSHQRLQGCVRGMGIPTLGLEEMTAVTQPTFDPFLNLALPYAQNCPDPDDDRATGNGEPRTGSQGYASSIHQKRSAHA